MGRLDGKVAVITGATSGIGLRTAEIFVAEGAKIVIAGRRAPEGEALARKLGAACVFRQTDVTVEEQMRALIGHTIEQFGRIDCLFNNAGGPAQTGGIEGLEVARFDAAMATLVRSVMLGMKHAAPHMRRQGAGSIINMASAAVLTPAPGVGAYAICKAGVAQLTQSMAIEVGRHGVRVNTIAPGYVPTNMTARYYTTPDGTIDEEAKAAVLAPMAKFTPLRRVGRTSDIGYCVLYLASDASSFVTGQLLSPNGGVAMHY